MATHSSPVAGKSHGQRSLAGYSPQGCTESDTIEAAEQQQQQHRVGGGFPGAQMGKTLPAVQETQVPSLGLGRSPGDGNGFPLQCSCLENLIDRGAWQATVHRIANSQTRLSN